MKKSLLVCACCMILLFAQGIINAQVVHAVSSSNLGQLQLQAKAGDAKAQFRLGIAYMDGVGVKASNTKAYKWFAAATAQKYAPAQYKLAQCITYGVGTESNIQKAAALYKKAADQGVVDAQYYLGLMYLYGTGVEQNETVGWQWIQRAAMQGHTEAIFKMGARYYDQLVSLNDAGASVLVDSAKYWLLQAGSRNHEQALTLLGNINELLYLYEENLLIYYDSTSLNPDDTNSYPPVLFNGEMEVYDYLVGYVLFPHLASVFKFGNCRVGVHYVVEEDGHVSHVRVQDPGPLPEFAEEGYRALLCLPILSPGFKGNYAVRVFENVRIPFYR